MPLFSHEQLHSTQGHRLTRSLFKETAKGADQPVMTLARYPKDDLVQLAPIFIEYVTEDPSEYEFALHVFGNFAHWKLIAESTWMQPYLEEWRMETDVRRKSSSFRRVYEEATSDGRSAYQAAKYLIEEPWKDKRNPKTQKAHQASNTKAAEGIKDDVLRMKDFMKNG